MEMVCGGRALTYLSQIYHQNRMVSQTFSAKPLETGAAAQRMAQELETCRARAGRLEARYLPPLPHPPRAPETCSF